MATSPRPRWPSIRSPQSLQPHRDSGRCGTCDYPRSMAVRSVTIRDAVDDDVQEILAIYNDVIASSTAVYRETPATFDDRREWFAARRAQSYPVLVALAAGASGEAADNSGVLGFASYGDFRTWPGYR